MRLLSSPKSLTIITICLITECILIGYIGVWREWFWDSVSNHQLYVFSYLLTLFAGVALLACFVSSYSQFLITIVATRMRSLLSEKALVMNSIHTEGFEQRLQEDCFVYPQLTLGLIFGGIRQVIITVVYAIIIIYQLGWVYLLFPIVYTLSSTIVTAYIAKPLIYLNYVVQVFEAKLRKCISPINLSSASRRQIQFARATKKLSYFQVFYGQITVLVPYLILAPVYFSMKITFGVLMQAASAIGEMITGLSYFINSFNDINKWLSCRKRLKEIGVL